MVYDKLLEGGLVLNLLLMHVAIQENLRLECDID